MPGVDWIRSFLKRNKNLTQRFGENIKRVRAGVSKPILDKYFNNLEDVLHDIPATNIFNYDETNFSDDPGKKLVIVRRGVKHPEIIRDSSKTSTSVMFCASADGNIVPPYTVYKAAHLYPTWVEGGIPGARYNRNISGWFDMAIFEDWFTFSFIPFIKNLVGTKVLIRDNLASHLSINVIKLCQINEVKFVLLPPNSTHLCQPLDLAFFRPLKSAWRNVLDKWKKKNRGVLPKSEFPQMLKKALESVQSPESNVKAEFKAAGIVPFDKQRVLARVKSKPEDEELEELNRSRSWTDAFVDILQEVRLGENTVKKPRGKKIAVEPGKSINVEDFRVEDVNENNIDDPETDNDTEIIEFNNDQEPSTSQAVPNHQQEIPVEFEIDNFILVKYETNKSYRHYIGQILDINYPIINVNFLRKKNSLAGPPTFVFPIVADKSRIKVTQVVKIVKVLSRQKRDRYIFDIDATEIE